MTDAGASSDEIAATWSDAEQRLTVLLGVPINGYHRTGWRKQGDAIKNLLPPKGPFNLTKIVHWFRHDKRGPGEHITNGPEKGAISSAPTSDMRLRLLEEQIKKLVLQNTKSEGRMVDIDVIRSQSLRLFASVKAWLQGNFPGIVYDIAIQNDRLEAIKRINVVTTERLNQWADALGEAPP